MRRLTAASLAVAVQAPGRAFPWPRLRLGTALPVVAILAVAASSGVAQGSGGTLDIAVANIRKPVGHVVVAVCTKAAFLTETCPYTAAATAHAGTVVVAVRGVPPGTYAVQAFQDEADTGRLERSILGVPKEGVGFSRDAPFRFGPPRFDDAAFTLGPDGGQVAFGLSYFD